MGQVMTSPTKRSRASLALILAVSLLAVTPGPAVAVDGKADHRPAYTACLGEATTSSGFSDVKGLIVEKAVDCIAYYGITVGTQRGLYVPRKLITRWQMALFLVRASKVAGISLPAPSDQGFRDIADRGQNTRDAINRMAALGIMRGTSSTTFVPDGHVDRRQMALFLHRFLLRSPVGPGGVDAREVAPDDSVFRDIGGVSPSAAGVSPSAANAIRVLYEMGVTVGTTSTTFSPRSKVTRGQMALFVTRALAHTNARPTGVTIQGDSSTVSVGDTLNVHISVRDQDRLPLPGSLVDVFSTAADNPYGAFDSDGACVRGVEVAFGGDVCTIDRHDRRLDERGNLFVILQPSDQTVLWAWAGEIDAEFRLNSTTAGSFEIEVLKPAAAVRVRDDMRRTAGTLKLGHTVKLTFQLVDDDGRLVSDGGVAIQISATFDKNGVTDQTVTKTHRTDDQGQVNLSFQGADPDRTGDDDTVELDLDLEVRALDVLDQTTLGVVADDADDDDDVPITWSESRPVPSTLRLGQSISYHELPRSGPGTVHLVRATLTDQYGDPVPNSEVDFSSDDPAGLGSSPVRQDTNSRGVAVVRYLRDGSQAGPEHIAAETSGGAVEARPINHYWAIAQDSGRTALGLPILVADTRNNVIVVDPARPALVRYDENDRFKIIDNVVTGSDFEKALASGDYKRLSFTSYSTDPEDISSFELTNTRIYDDA